MARSLNKLTAKKVESISFDGKNKKYSDGGGLYLHVKKTGKYWHLKYYFDGKEKLTSLGVFPAVSLADARIGRDEKKKLLREGKDPVGHKRAKVRLRESAESNTFERVALEWLEEVHFHKVSESHAVRNLGRFKKYIFPKIGNYPVSEITAPELLRVLKALEKKDILETVSRVRSLCSQVFRYAMVTGRATSDPAAVLSSALRPPKEKHLPAITNPDEVGALLRAIDSYSGNTSTCNALRIAPYLFVRPGELRHAKWCDFDLDNSIWSYQPSKNGLPFEFPLSYQVIEILLEQQWLSKESEYVFPSARSMDRPMSNNTLSGALNRLDYKGKMSVHGFRATARTILAERLNFPIEQIEQQLAHNVRDINGRAYNRTTYFEQRKEMMQVWADYLDSLRLNFKTVIPIKRKA